MSCPDENRLVLFCEGCVDAAERDRIEAHLDGCAACTRLFRELAVIANASADDSPSLPERYRLVRRLGRGATGEVWEADDRHLVRRVAIKRLRPELAGSPAHRDTLLAEARILAGLSHPQLVPVHDAGLDGEQLWIAMAHVGGVSARAWLAQRQPSWREVLGAWLDVAAGLDAAHRAGVVHRDVKPDNVIVAPDGRALLGDFGLALSTRAALDSAGTPAYMAPEALRGEAADESADQFALCASIWEQLTCARPFHGDSVETLLDAVERGPGKPRRGDVAPAVFSVLRRGLMPSPEARFASVAALRSALELAARSRPPRTWRRATVAVLLVALPLGLRLAISGDDDAAAGADPASIPDRSANSARASVDRATDELTEGRPRGCLAILEALEPGEVDLRDEAEVLHGLCQMAAGDCVGGRERLANALRRPGRSPAAIEDAIDAYDAMHCPLDAPGSPELLRLRYQTHLLVALGRDQADACQTVLAGFEEIAPADLEGFGDVTVLAAHCAAKTGDCAGAEALIERALPDAYARAGQLTALQRTYPGCAGR